MRSAREALQSWFVPAGLAAFTVLTGLLAFVALNRPLVERAGMWPHVYFLAISAQWAALGIACVGLSGSSARAPSRIWHRARARAAARRGPALAALLLFHALMALASVLMGFADALVGGQRLPGFLVELLPREGQLLMLLLATWGVMLAAAGFLWMGTRRGMARPRHHAAVIGATLLTGAVAYWGWGWSRFYPVFQDRWFSLWKVGAADIAVNGPIFQALLVALPLVHGAMVAWLALQLLRMPLQAPAHEPGPEPVQA